MKKRLCKLFKRVLSVALVVAMLVGMKAVVPAKAQELIDTQEALETTIDLKETPEPSNMETLNNAANITNGEIYRIRQVSSGNYLDVLGTIDYDLRYSTADNGHSILVSPFRDHNDQLWLVEEVDGGYRITSIGDIGMILNVVKADYGDGNPVGVRPANKGWTNAQRFDLLEMSDGSYQIQTTRWAFTDYCLSFDGTEVIQRPIDDVSSRKWQFIKKGTLTFDAGKNGGSTSALPLELFEGTTVNLNNYSAEKDYARFLGWNTADDAKEGLGDTYTMGSGDRTLYAIFENMIEVTYDCATNGGESLDDKATFIDRFYKDESVKLNHGAKKTETNVMPEGEFLGWNTDKDAREGFDSLTMEELITLAGREDNLTLYAIYKHETPVEFIDFDGDSLITRDVVVTTYNNEPREIVIAPEQNCPDGWTALGWTHRTEGDAAPDSPPEGGETPFYLSSCCYGAHYYGLYSVPVTLTYDADGGEFTPHPETKDQFLNSYDLDNPVNPAYTLAYAPRKLTHQFSGWTDGTTIWPEQADVAFGKHTTLTAVWNATKVNGIRLSLNNLIIGEGQTAELQAFVTPANATNAGYSHGHRT